jgi:S1-C subfamily serine protease
VERTRRRQSIAAAAAALALIAGIGAFAFRDDSPPPLTQADVDKAAATIVDKALKKAAAAPAKSALVYQQIAPSLVVIQTEGKPAPIGVTPDGDEFDPSDPNDPKTPDGFGLGTGVIINQEGAILTANHVIDGATSITLIYADGTEAEAIVVSTEPEKDIAVLISDTKPEVIVPAVLGGGVRVGDETYAVGNPLGLAASMSAGVISGLDRSIPIDEELTLDGLIQFDAAVNPGNSGGPLLNRNGQVVGIVTALANPSKTGFFVGIGFAVPIDQAGGAAGGPPQ